MGIEDFLVGRHRLPNRRPSETFNLQFNDGRRIHLTIGFYPEGDIGEVFLHGGKTGSDADGLNADIGTLISRAIQHGDTPVALAKGMGRLGTDRGPASLIGAVCDMLATVAAEAGADA